MTPKIAYIAIAAAFIAAMVLGRYGMEPAGQAPGVFLLDRWTGDVFMISTSGKRRVNEGRDLPWRPTEPQPLLNDVEVFGK